MLFDAIYFDLDGTLADLYGVEDWLPKLRNRDASPYAEAAPLVDMARLNFMLEQFAKLGVTIGVISWLAKGSVSWYDKMVRNAKQAWLEEHLPVATEIHFVAYGTTKKSAAKRKNAILVDDNDKVRKGWTGYATIDAKGDILADLKKYLDMLERRC